jgi:hypothetical protein
MNASALTLGNEILTWFNNKLKAAEDYIDKIDSDIEAEQSDDDYLTVPDDDT